MQGSSGDAVPVPDAMARDLGRAARTLRGAGSALVVTHIDADGISAGAIADATLERLGVEHEVRFAKKMTDGTVAEVNGSGADVVWVCDLGSGCMGRFSRDGLVVTDHHVPDPGWRGSTTLEGFATVHHLNPHPYGLDGSFEVCGAGMTYLLSRAVDPGNADLSHLAVVGAVGDFQDSASRRLVSLNRTILMEAVDAGEVAVEEDLRFFGRDTRPLNQFLQYASEPRIPGLSDDPRACLGFLDSLGIPGKEGGRWRSWSDLEPGERERAAGRIRELLGDGADSAFGETYRVTRYGRSTGLSDAKEFATVLNSCGRYDDAESGLRVCRGDASAREAAAGNRAEHRRSISSALSYVRDNHLVRERRYVQWFDAGSEIRETVVGTVAGMVLSSPGCRSDLPIVAFADSDDGVKVSARASRDLVDRGLDLSAVMKTAADRVGGFGGGHTVAAGATIPPGAKEEFLEIVEDLVSAQVMRSSVRRIQIRSQNRNARGATHWSQSMRQSAWPAGRARTRAPRGP